MTPTNPPTERAAKLAKLPIDSTLFFCYNSYRFTNQIHRNGEQVDKTSIYLNAETKARIEKLKPTHLSMVNFIRAMAENWNESTPEQQIKAINATKKEISE